MFAFVGADALDLIQARVRATPRTGHLHAGGRLRFPIERDVSDGHRRTRYRTLLDQRVLDAETPEGRLGRDQNLLRCRGPDGERDLHGYC